MKYDHRTNGSLGRLEVLRRSGNHTFLRHFSYLSSGWVRLFYGTSGFYYEGSATPPGREGGREEGRKGGREEGRKRGREGSRKGGMEGGGEAIT